MSRISLGFANILNKSGLFKKFLTTKRTINNPHIFSQQSRRIFMRITETVFEIHNFFSTIQRPSFNRSV